MSNQKKSAETIGRTMDEALRGLPRLHWFMWFVECENNAGDVRLICQSNDRLSGHSRRVEISPSRTENAWDAYAMDGDDCVDLHPSASLRTLIEVADRWLRFDQVPEKFCRPTRVTCPKCHQVHWPVAWCSSSGPCFDAFCGLCNPSIALRNFKGCAACQISEVHFEYRFDLRR